MAIQQLLHVCRKHSFWMHLNTLTQAIIGNHWVIYMHVQWWWWWWWYVYIYISNMCSSICIHLLTTLEFIRGFVLWSNESEQLSSLMRPYREVWIFECKYVQTGQHFSWSVILCMCSGYQTYTYGGFLKQGYPQIIYLIGCSLKNHPFGAPPYIPS